MADAVMVTASEGAVFLSLVPGPTAELRVRVTEAAEAGAAIVATTVAVAAAVATPLRMIRLRILLDLVLLMRCPPAA
ncbi:hypothetical protein Areg01_55210 [Actinoplanes regularis]|nr:hypothetical protein Areg01_55210 [Actinoplanes regularis]